MLLTLGNVALMQDDLGGARTYYERGLPLYRRIGEQDGIARALGNLGVVMMVQGDFAEARVICEESLAVLRASGDMGKRGQGASQLGGNRLLAGG